MLFNAPTSCFRRRISSGSPRIVRLFAHRLLTIYAHRVGPLIPNVLLAEGPTDREQDLEAVLDGHFDRRLFKSPRF